MSAAGATDSAEVDLWSGEATEELLDVVNEWYDDVLALFAHGFGGHAGATGARLVSVDSTALHITARHDTGPVALRVDFTEPMTSPDGFYGELATLIERARAAAPDAPLTEYEQGGDEHQRIRTFLTEVVEVVDLHPHLREITFGGADLETFEPLGADTYLYVLVPPRGRSELTIGRDFSWEAVGEMPTDEQPGGAYYSLRRWDHATQRLTMHFVLHGDEGSGSAWALQAAAGQPAALWGPRTGFTPPADTEWLLVVADETGLPAAATILEQLPPGQRAIVFAEVADPSEQQALPDSPSIEVTWLYRSGAPAGTTTLLVDAVRALPWPAGTAYAWGGGESRSVTAVRKYLRNEVGLPRDAVSMTGYWRRTAAGA